MKINLPAIYSILISIAIAALGGVLEYLKVEGAAFVWTPLALMAFQALLQYLKVRKSTLERINAVARGEAVAQPESKMRKFLLG
jgi:hypothetical protein